MTYGTLASVFLAAILALAGIVPGPGVQGGPTERERAYRANNLGVARLEQFDYDGAAQSFGEALKIDPALAIAPAESRARALLWEQARRGAPGSARRGRAASRGSAGSLLARVAGQIIGSPGGGDHLMASGPSTRSVRRRDEGASRPGVSTAAHLRGSHCPLP